MCLVPVKDKAFFRAYIALHNIVNDDFFISYFLIFIVGSVRVWYACHFENISYDNIIYFFS